MRPIREPSGHHDMVVPGILGEENILAILALVRCHAMGDVYLAAASTKPVQRGFNRTQVSSRVFILDTDVTIAVLNEHIVAGLTNGKRPSGSIPAVDMKLISCSEFVMRLLHLALPRRARWRSLSDR